MEGEYPVRVEGKGGSAKGTGQGRGAGTPTRHSLCIMIYLPREDPKLTP